MNLLIVREQISKYQQENFPELEKKTFSALSAGYHYGRPFPDSPFALITTTNTVFDEEIIKNLDNIKILVQPNSGYDNIPSSFVKDAPFPIVTGNSLRSRGVATYTLSCLFSHLQTPPFVTEWNHSRKWDRLLLEDQNILIIGFGHIGKILNNALSPLTENIHIYDPYENPNSKLPKEQVDIVLLASSLNKTSHHIIDQAFLNSFQPSLIINGARGKLINTTDLVSYLKSNRSSYAYLDVFEIEPNDFSQFEGLQNVKLSSHIAGVHNNLDQKILDYEFKVFKDFLNLEKSEFEQSYKNLILQNKLIDNTLI